MIILLIVRGGHDRTGISRCLSDFKLGQGPARLVRGQVMQLRNRDYVNAARVWARPIFGL